MYGFSVTATTLEFLLDICFACMLSEILNFGISTDCLTSGVLSAAVLLILSI